MQLVVYSLILLLIFLSVINLKLKIPFLNIILLGIIIRVLFLFLLPSFASYDTNSFLIAGKLTVEKINIYPEVAGDHAPYFPLIIYLEALAVKLSKMINPIFLFKSFLMCFDVLTIYLVYLFTKKDLNKTFAYSVNPVTTLIIAFHGQFDVIPIFFILLSIYMIKKKRLFSLLSFSTAVALKTFPVLFFVPLLKSIKKFPLIFVILFIPIIVSIIYTMIFQSDIFAIFKVVYNYRSAIGNWGLLSLLSIPFRSPAYAVESVSNLFLIIFMVYSFILHEKDLAKYVMKLMFFFFVFSPGFAIQYLFWIIPFMIISMERNDISNPISVITSYLTVNYFLWTVPAKNSADQIIIELLIKLTALLLWLLFVYLFLKHSFQAKKRIIVVKSL